MAETIHFSEKFRSTLAKYFASKSLTEGLYNHDIDSEFTGTDTVHIYEIAVTDMNSYNKAQDPSTGSRFGTVKEVGDHQYTFKLTQDESFDRSIDRGNNDAQLFFKKVGAVMKAYMDKLIRPNKDKYRFKKWIEEAGIHTALSAAPAKNTIVQMILDLHSAMIDENVPADTGTLVISREYLTALKLSDEFLKLTEIGSKVLPKGAVGMLDGLAVLPVSKRLLPANVYFAIFVKDSIIAPEKINLFRAIKDSENMDGDRIQYRCKYDAFVMPSLAAGAAVACAKDTVATTPTIAIASNKATITAGTDETIYYTLDGSDPRYKSADAKVYSAAVTLASGETIRACAKKDGLFMSGVAEATN